MKKPEPYVIEGEAWRVEPVRPWKVNSGAVAVWALYVGAFVGVAIQSPAAAPWMVICAALIEPVRRGLSAFFGNGSVVPKEDADAVRNRLLRGWGPSWRAAPARSARALQPVADPPPGRPGSRRRGT